MTAQRHMHSKPGKRKTIPEQVKAFFQAGGMLEKACRHESFIFEIRPQQMAMAEAVAQAVLKPDHLVVEAGTGVGKTFAYLVPVILTALEKKSKVAVSTHTINLQEQLVFTDIPFLKQHMGLDLKVALCKGRNNYLCLRRLSLARRMSGDLFNKAQERELDRIRQWADQTRDGSLSDFDSFVPGLWSHVCSEHDNCLGRKCSYYGRCFLVRARARAFDADILILNHHLFFSDLALRKEKSGPARRLVRRSLSGEGGSHQTSPDGFVRQALGEGGFLPEFDILVLDEAHYLEETAGDHLGIRLSQGAFEHWLRRLYVPGSGKGLLAALKQGKAAHEVSRLWDEHEHFFLEVKRWANLDGNDVEGDTPSAETKRVVAEPLAFQSLLVERITKVVYQLTPIGESIENPDIQAELTAICRRGNEIRDSLDVFLKQSLDNQVYWVELEGARRRFVLYSAPIEVGPILEQILFNSFKSRRSPEAKADKSRRSPEAKADKSRRSPEAKADKSIVMTSASLSVDGSLEYFKKRIGARTSRALIVGSPFNYSRQMRVFIARGMPDPNKKGVRCQVSGVRGQRDTLHASRDTVHSFTDAVAQGICYFVKKTHGRAFVLFTSAEMMKNVASQLQPFFAEQGLKLLVQGTGLPRHVMLEQFKQIGDATAPASQRGCSRSAVRSEEGRRAERDGYRDASGAVLFGLESFWTGVDVRGEALSSVMIVRLPFAVPSEPVTKARMDRISEQGGDAFREYSLPEAVLKFRQGIGRLIRTATDEGIIVVLDSRILTRWYGRMFLKAIPECPKDVVDCLGG